MLFSDCQKKKEKKFVLFSLQLGKGNILKFNLGSLHTDIKPSKCRQALWILQPQISQLIWVILLLYSKAFSTATELAILSSSGLCCFWFLNWTHSAPPQSAQGCIRLGDIPWGSWELSACSPVKLAVLQVPSSFIWTKQISSLLWQI